MSSRISNQRDATRDIDHAITTTSLGTTVSNFNKIRVRLGMPCKSLKNAYDSDTLSFFTNLNRYIEKSTL